jgi:hypothetical protein
MRRILLGLVTLAIAGEPALAFRIGDAGPALGVSASFPIRWDAAPRTVFGEERSLDGGLRYSVEGGSYEAFRDQFQWYTVPTVDEFQGAVEAAFAAWESVDPVTGLGTSLYFVEDFGTEISDDPGVVGNPGSYTGVNYGAEIDLIAETPHLGPGYGGSVIWFLHLASANNITLTSGTTGYEGFAISGADVRINPEFVYDLDWFQILLTHELGHAIGLTDADVFPGAQGINSPFLDDDYDGTSNASALATLTNSFALEIDPLDPSSTPLIQVFADLNDEPGLGTSGVNVLMETDFDFSLRNEYPPLQNDDYAGRQYLYPVAVPEPALAFLGSLAALASAWARRSTT